MRTIWKLTSQTFLEWMDHGVAAMAAGLAFYTLFSFAPILIILLAIIGSFFGEDAARMEIVAIVRQASGPNGAELTDTVIRDISMRVPQATTFGVIALGFTATAVFASLQDALNAIWSVAPRPGNIVWPYVRKRLMSFCMVLLFGAVLMLSFIAGTAVSAVLRFSRNILPATATLVAATDFALWLSILTILFAMIYKVLPDARVRWRDVWVGGAVASVLFTAGKMVISAYLVRSNLASTFGAASSVVFLLLWVYYSAQIFLLCGAFTHVYARWRGAEIRPDAGAVRVVRNYVKA
jgi:membrane protein